MAGHGWVSVTVSAVVVVSVLVTERTAESVAMGGMLADQGQPHSPRANRLPQFSMVL
jgi:hypothetical protein